VADNERSLPLLAARDLILFPKMLIPIFVGREKSVRALERAHQAGSSLILATQLTSVEEPGEADIASVGTLAKVVQFFRLTDGTVKALLEGQGRVAIEGLSMSEPHLEANYRPLEMRRAGNWSRVRALMEAVSREFHVYVTQSPELPEEAETILEDVSDPGDLVDIVAANLLIAADRKQSLLEGEDPEQRLMTSLEVLMQENELLAIEHDIADRVHDNLERHQRKLFLRERIRLMQEELGEEEGEEGEQGRYLKQLEQKPNLSTGARAALEKEIRRLEDMPPFSAEIGVAQTYLDNVFALPWGEMSGAEAPNVAHVAKVLDDTHYGLSDVKDRIVEYLAVAQLRQGVPPKTVLCFVGPPGVGKTSISLAIAEGLRRPLQRISLGGVRDEAEIRGHRRTYVGAMPGRILDALKRAAVDDPIILLDELDKMESDWRGNPAAALMEVLDPVQNHAFRDTYLDLEYDLSHVLFLATANYEEDIPETLHDRLEIIRISGYTSREKEQIARRHLVPKTAEESGMAEVGDVFTRQALRDLIEDYTREPGVRELNRLAGKVYRKLARDRVEGKNRAHTRIGPGDLERYLGAPPYLRARLAEELGWGVSTGLAYTGAGGDILRIETAITPGKGDFHITGQLGEVMQESVTAAWGYLKTAIGRDETLTGIWRRSPGRARLLEQYLSEQPGGSAGEETGSDDGSGTAEPTCVPPVPPDYELLAALEIRLHLPEGAVPKEGPSAGIAVAASLLSALTETPLLPRVALSGEITLTGHVLAVGGLKEKLLAARREGVRKVILPEDVKGQVRELPAEIRKGLEIVYVRSFIEVLPQIFPEERS